METKNLRAFIIDKETGESREIQNPIGTLELSDFERQELQDGHYSFTADLKVRINKRTRSYLERLCRPRKLKYVAKHYVAQFILGYIANSKTYDELMRMSHKQMERYLMQLEIARQQVLENLPKGGIGTPSINRGEAVFSTEDYKRIKELIESPSQLDMPVVHYKELQIAMKGDKPN